MLEVSVIICAERHAMHLPVWPPLCSSQRLCWYKPIVHLLTVNYCIFVLWWCSLRSELCHTFFVAFLDLSHYNHSGYLASKVFHRVKNNMSISMHFKRKSLNQFYRNLPSQQRNRCVAAFLMLWKRMICY